MEFNIIDYKKKLSVLINTIFKKSTNDDLLEDILLNDYIKHNTDIIRKSKKLKQIQMKIGKIWQIAIGSYNNFIDLGEGDSSGCDIISHKRKIIIELKNRHNTDNASAKKTNINKLRTYVNNNNGYIGIYAVVNEKTKSGQTYKEDTNIILFWRNVFEIYFRR